MDAKVIDIFKVTRGDIVIMEFFRNARPFLGDILVDKSNHEWKIIEIATSNAIRVEKYKNLLHSNRVWDCTIVPIDHDKTLGIEEEVRIKKT